MKGWSILLIILHNYLHFTTIYDGNEFFYSENCTKTLLDNLCIPGILSFVGWAGVSIFIFLSGYGLAIKYKDSTTTFSSYFKHHIIKLWKLLIPVYILYLCIYGVINGLSSLDSIDTILEQLFLVINFLNPKAINPGVFWFFGLIMQFYLIFWIFRKSSGKTLLWIACSGIVLNYLLLYICNSDTASLLRHNFIGWIPSLFFGAAIAKMDIDWQNKKLKNYMFCIVSLALLTESFITKVFFPLTDVLVIAFTISIVKIVCIKPIYLIGIISSSIFVVHPLVRLVVTELTSYQYRYYYLLLYIIGVLVFSTLHYCIINRSKNLLSGYKEGTE